jgi:hypothetical protein
VSEPSRGDRILTTVMAGLFAGWLSWKVGDHGDPAVLSSDFHPLWAAAGVLLQGGNPYTAVGPGRVIEWPFPLYYPLPALLALAPLALLPVRIALTVFMGTSSALLAYLVSGGPHKWRLLVFVSAALQFGAGAGQWATLMSAAALAPTALGIVFAFKPTIGAAAWAREWRWKALLAPAALTLLSVLLYPWWPRQWLHALSGISRPPLIASMFGWPIALAALRWRQPEARLLFALACVPQSMFIYECVPLFLVARTKWECAYLTVATWVVVFGTAAFFPPPPMSALNGEPHMAAVAAINTPIFAIVLYLPCLWMVLRRPNSH